MGSKDFLERLDRLLKATEGAACSAGAPPLPEGYSGAISWAEHKRKFVELPRTGLAFDLIVVELGDVDRDVDRTATMLSGPFYTSELFPWPLAGKFSWEPIIQIDLASASLAFGTDVGTGLLQVWQSDPDDWGGMEEFTTRYIPAQDVAAERLTPVPGDLRCCPDKTHARRAKTDTAPWNTSALLPSKLKRVVSIHDELDSYLASLADDWEGPPALVAEANNLRDACEKLSRVDGDYLFGNYYPRGYDASLDMLLAQVSEKHFSWGDDGKGILLLSHDADPSQAQFTWFD